MKINNCLDKDNAWWRPILERSQQWNISSNTCASINSFLEGRKTTITEGQSTVNMNVARGCPPPQGSVLGPMLWRALFDGLIRSVEGAGFRVVAYVDNLAATAYGSTQIEDHEIPIHDRPRLPLVS